MGSTAGRPAQADRGLSATTPSTMRSTTPRRGGAGLVQVATRARPAPTTGIKGRTHADDVNPGCRFLDPRDSRRQPVRAWGRCRAHCSQVRQRDRLFLRPHPRHATRWLGVRQRVGLPQRTAKGNWWEITTASTPPTGPSRTGWPGSWTTVTARALSLMATVLDRGPRRGAPPPPHADAHFLHQRPPAGTKLASWGRLFSRSMSRNRDAGGVAGRRAVTVQRRADRQRPARREWCGRVHAGHRPEVASKAIGRAHGTGRSAPPCARPTRAPASGRAGTIDRYCLLDGGNLRVRVRSAKLRGQLSQGERYHIPQGPPRYSCSAISPTTGCAAFGQAPRCRRAQRRVENLRRYKLGPNSWYLARGSRSRLVFRSKARRCVRPASQTSGKPPPSAPSASQPASSAHAAGRAADSRRRPGEAPGFHPQSLAAGVLSLVSIPSPFLDLRYRPAVS